MHVYACVRLIPSPGFPHQLSWEVAWEEGSERKELSKLALMLTNERLELELWCIGLQHIGFGHKASFLVPALSHQHSVTSCISCPIWAYFLVSNDIAPVLVEHIKHIKLVYILITFNMWIPCLKWNFYKYWNSRGIILEFPGYYVSSSHLSSSVYFTYQWFYIRNLKTNVCFDCTKESSRTYLSYKKRFSHCCVEPSRNWFTLHCPEKFVLSYLQPMLSLYYRTKYRPYSFLLFVRLCLWLRSSTWRLEELTFPYACIGHWL